jgi:dipeptidyl aminopeptidase/acylaminoacyl peptidase
MKPADIGDLVDVSDPRLSPDGRRVAYVVTTIDLDANEYRSRIWLAATDGSEAPRPLTAGEKRDARPRWSPDGRQLAFVSHRDDDTASQLYVLPVDRGGEVAELAAWKEEIEALEWSPDGTRIAFAARLRDEERYGKEKAKDQPPRRVTRLFSRLDSVGWTFDRPRQLFVVPADGSAKPVALTSEESGVSGLSWSPDGTRVVFSAQRHDDYDLDQIFDLFTVSVGVDGGGEPQKLTDTSATFSRAEFSPDGSQVAFGWGQPDVDPSHGQVGVLDATSGEPRLLTTALDRNCAGYGTARAVAWDGADLLFPVDDGGNVPLYRVAADGNGKPEVVIGGDRYVTGFDVRDGVVAFAAADATHLTDLYVLDPGGSERQLTTHCERFVALHPPVAPERFIATSTGGAEVEAWIIRPADFDPSKTYPALLNVHGGPFTQYGNKVFDEFQVQAGAGYAVIYCNPRGSSGYSEAWGRAIRGPIAEVEPGSGWGGVDYDDVMAVTEEAVRRFAFVDGERLGVLGGSYGGYMTSWIIGHSDRFKAACSERAVNNLLAEEHNSDIAGIFKQYVGATHLDAPEEYLRQSPVTYVRDMHTPLLILHSEDDLRCPISQAEELFVALRLLKREVEFVRFPGESHELTRAGAPKHRVMRFELLLEFFGRHLLS